MCITNLSNFNQHIYYSKENPSFFLRPGEISAYLNTHYTHC